MAVRSPWLTSFKTVGRVVIYSAEQYFIPFRGAKFLPHLRCWTESELCLSLAPTVHLAQQLSCDELRLQR